MMNQVISTTGFESPCLTKGESCRFSPLWSNGPQLHGGNPIGFVPASRGGVYIKSKTHRAFACLFAPGADLLRLSQIVTPPHLFPSFVSLSMVLTSSFTLKIA